MTLKTKQIRKQPHAERATRRSKFQADLAPAEDRMVRGLKQELQLTSNTDFLSDALALFRWAVWERKRGHRIFSETETGERKELVFPRLERVARNWSSHAWRFLGQRGSWRVLQISHRENPPMLRKLSSGQ